MPDEGDPTKNVRELMDAAVRALTDKEILQAALADEKVKRVEQLVSAQKEIANLTACHNKEIRHMESDRVDKIRSVDVANAAATAAQLLSAVTTLATTAQATAETLRNQVAATAAAVASQTERVVNPIIERIALLEKSSYTGAGKQLVTDPQLTELITEMKATRVSNGTATGKSEGINAAWVILSGIVALVAALVATGAILFAKAKEPAASSVAPQVVYVPTPPSVMPTPAR